MFRILCIASLVTFLAACSTTPGGGHPPDTAVMGAAGATFKDTVGPKGNGP